MNKWSFIVSLPLSLFAVEASTVPQELLLRRIQEFWKDGDTSLVKQEINNFVYWYPEDPELETLYAFLGDLLFEEGEFSQAAAAYEKLSSQPKIKECLPRWLYCYQQTKDFSSLIERASSIDEEELSDEARLLFAETLVLEKKKKEAEKSIHLYESIENFELRQASLPSLAKALSLAEQYESSASLWMRLAADNPKEQEAYLFQAALALEKIDPKEAERLFKIVIFQEGKEKQEALSHLGRLQIAQERYTEFLELPLSDSLELIYLKLFALYKLGQSDSFFALFARQELSSFSQEVQKQLLEIAMEIAYTKKDSVLYQKSLEAYEPLSFFYETPLFYFNFALLLKEEERLQEAQDFFEKASFLPERYQETFLKEYGQVSFENRDFESSAKAWEEYLKINPESELGWEYLLESLYQKETSSGEYWAFFDAVSRALDHLPSWEKGKDYQQLKAHLLFEERRFEEVLTLLESDTTAKSTLLKALTYQKMGHLDLFRDYAEKAVFSQKDPKIEYKVGRAYLETDWIEEGKEWLFSAFIKERTLLSNQELSWMADEYMTSVQSPIYALFLPQESDPLLERSKVLLEERIARESFPSLELESLLLKQVDLYRAMDLPYQESLSSLLSLYAQETTLPWKRQGETYWKWAQWNELNGLPSAALESIECALSYLSPKSWFHSYLLNHKYRIQSELDIPLTSEEKSEMLTHLKDLQILKNPLSEPLHLEAALIYAEIRSKEPSEPYSGFFFKRVLEDFFNQEDPLSLSYQQQIFEDPSELCRSYLHFVENRVEGIDRQESIQLNPMPYYLYLQSKRGLK